MLGFALSTQGSEVEGGWQAKGGLSDETQGCAVGFGVRRALARSCESWSARNGRT